MQVAAVLVLALAACVAPGPAAAQQRIAVAATSTDLKSLVEAVGGERVEVESLTAPSQDPHSVELRPAQLARLRRAALVVRVGLDHEPWFSRLPIRNVPVVDASRNVRLLQAETPRLRAERKAHVHAYGNTHYWLDPRNARPITASILEALSALSPADRQAMAARREAFLALLDRRSQAWSEAMQPYRGTKVVVVHDSWAYFADRFGFSIAAAAEPTPGVPPSPAELAALFRRMREAQVAIVIADPHSSPALLRQLAERGGARAVTLFPSVGAGPGADDYVQLFETNVKRLEESLKGAQKD